MKQTNSLLREATAPSLNQKSAPHAQPVELEPISVREMHSAIGGNLENIRKNIKAARLERLMARQLEGELEGSAELFSHDANTPLPENVHSLRPSAYAAMQAAPDPALTNDLMVELKDQLETLSAKIDSMETAAFKSQSKDDNGTDIDSYNAIVATHQKQLNDVFTEGTYAETLEAMRKFDVEQLTLSQLELAEHSRTDEDIEAAKDWQITRLTRMNKSLEQSNADYFEEIEELKVKLKARSEIETQRSDDQHKRIKELEFVLRQAKRQLDIKILEFKSLSQEHKDVNQILIEQEQTIRGLKKPYIVE